MAGQFQPFLDKVKCLDHFQPDFGFSGIVTAWVTLEDNRGAQLLLLLFFSAASSSTHHGILLSHLSGQGLGATVLWWFQSPVFSVGGAGELFLRLVGPCMFDPVPHAP